MEIVERRNHSMPVHYVDRGRDATINSVGNIIDFKFRNNTSSDVIIMAYTDGNILHMEIYGVPFETDEYDRIEIRTKQRGSVSIKTVYEYDDSKPASYSKRVSPTTAQLASLPTCTGTGRNFWMVSTNASRSMPWPMASRVYTI